MQVIEALFIGIEEPHDYLHINHVRAVAAERVPCATARHEIYEVGPGCPIVGLGASRAAMISAYDSDVVVWQLWLRSEGEWVSGARWSCARHRGSPARR